MGRCCKELSVNIRANRNRYKLKDIRYEILEKDLDIGLIYPKKTDEANKQSEQLEMIKK